MPGDTKLTNLPAGGPVGASDVFYSVQSGVDVQQSASALKAFATSGLILSSGPVNINTLTSSPLVPDGVTSNATQLQSLASVLQGVGIEFPVPVTITSVGGVATFTLNLSVPSGGQSSNNNHYLKPNQSFFLTPGSVGATLPTGLSFNTPYYITAANLTSLTTFTASAVNNYSYLIGEGSPITITGSASGTINLWLTGRDVNILIPPGPYFTGIFGDPTPNIVVTPNGMTRVRYWAYGAMFDTKVKFGAPYVGFADAKTWTPYVYDLVNTPPNSYQSPQSATVVTLQVTANAANYYVGQWVCFLGGDVQDFYGVLTSGPPNNQYQEFKRIVAINLGAGQLTFDGPLRNTYLSTFPNLYNQPSGQGFGQGGGVAMICQMHPSWDTEIEVRGLRQAAQSNGSFARRFSYIDCVFEGYGAYAGVFAPTLTKEFIVRNCRLGYGDPDASPVQIDKCMEYLEWSDTEISDYLQVSFGTPGLQTCVIKNFNGPNVLFSGTPKNIKMEDSFLATYYAGPVSGITDTIQLTNNEIVWFQMLNRDDDSNTPPSPSNDMALLPSWTFSGSTFSRNLSGVTQALNWIVPGAVIYFTDAANFYKYYQNMGCFKILNVYMSGSTVSFDTTLGAIPPWQASATVTMTIGTSTVNWTAHGLSTGMGVCFNTTGALPTGVTHSTIYYVTNTTANTFQVSATSGGSAITMSGSQSGTHTGYGNPLMFRPHPCPSFTGSGNRGSDILVDHNGMIDEPMFSQICREFGGIQSNLGGSSQAYQQPNPYIWGNFTNKKYLTVNVMKAASAGTLTISCAGFTQASSGGPSGTNPLTAGGTSPFSQVIDVTHTGIRTINNSAIAGLLGADAISPYVDWIAGPVVFTWSNSVSTTGPTSPIVEVEMQTHQGIARFSNLMGSPTGSPTQPSSLLWKWQGGRVIQQYGTNP